ncbi:M16 family metallopeptidase [Portibacter marinus]|uniref:M16 family metallopeptidase n=1 Tax=Portibacter marinus TaxID=2898660 RepID=UPI001F253524|nr:insulinase family protein [Portibacter marinus]
MNFKLNTLILLLLVFLINSCSPKTSQKIDNTVEEVEEDLTQTADDAEEALDEAGEAISEEAEEAMEGMDQAAKTVVVEVDETMEMVEEGIEDLSEDPIPADDDVVIGSLANGMRYYIQSNQKPDDRAELRLIVDAGSMQEDDDQLGVAHFVEHMAFNGSKNFEKNELVDFLESIGTKFGPDLNAYTSFDETVYMLQVRTDSMELFDKGLLVLSDWANGISFDEEEIDKERGVVTSEWRTRLSGEQRMQKNYFPIMYHGSRYAERLPIGDPEIINNADYETIRRFYRDWYRPDLMAVAVVGDIDVKETEQKIKELFAPIPPATVKREKKDNVVPKHEETFVSINSDKEAAFTILRLMYKHDHIAVRTDRDYRESLVRQLYNRMLNNRLDEITKQAEPPFIFAYSGYGRDVGDLDTYTSFANVPEGKVESALEVLLTENERALRHGFNESELERQKIAMMENIKRQAKEQDKIDSRRLVTRYVYHYLRDNPIPSIDQQLEYYEEYLPTITVDEINRLAENWITPENRVIVVTAPKKEDVPLPSEEDLLAIVESIEEKEIEPYEDKVIDVPLFDEELDPVAIEEVEHFEEVDVKEFELANGVRVVMKPTDFKNDEILMTASSEGGTSLYDDADYFNASNAARIVNESGLGDFTTTDLEKLLTGKTVGVYPYIGTNFEGLSGSSAPKDLETLMQLIYMYFTDVRRDEQAFKSFINKQSNIYKNLMSNPQYYFMDYAMKKKTDNHPRVGFPSVDDIMSIDLDRALEIYNERFADASGFTFIFVGNFEEDRLKELAQKYLGNLPSKGMEETWKNRNIDYVEGEIKDEFKMGEAPKTQVELFFHGPFEWTPENSYHFNAMLDVLRIKMRESMREDKGGVYGVRVSGNASKIPEERYTITVSFNCDPENTEELITTAMQDVQNAVQSGAEEKDLTKVKETQRQSMIKNLKENNYWRSRLEYVYSNDLSPTTISLDKLEQSIHELDSDDIKDAASKYFGSGNYMRIVMQPGDQPSN